MNMENREEVKLKISSIIAEIQEEDYKLLEESNSLVNDIGLDSMSFLELAIQIQRSFGTLIPSEEWKAIVTVKDLMNTIEQKTLENAQL
jgi:acyl carrier protein